MWFFQFIKRNLCWGIVTPKTGRLGRLYTFECTWALSTNFCHHTVVLSPQPKGTRGNFDKWKRRRKKIIKYLLKVFKSTTNEISLGIMWEGIRFSLNRFFLTISHFATEEGCCNNLYKAQSRTLNEMHTKHVCFLFFWTEKREKNNLKFAFCPTNHVKFSLGG